MNDWLKRKFSEQKIAENFLICPKSPTIIGVDEVGRGCLSGPVVACALMIDYPQFPEQYRDYIIDSKKLSKSMRQKIAPIIRTHCSLALGSASVAEIDQINILQASLLAMRRAVAKLAFPQNGFALVDGNKLPLWDVPSAYIIKGDQSCPSISAASIFAKVARDRLMQIAHTQYPDYGWNNNAGYGVKTHLEAIKRIGITPYHRRSFKMPR